MLTGQKKDSRDNAMNLLFFLAVCYFVPGWVILLLMAYCLFAIYYTQVQYRKALALADQFYDRTIYRYNPEVASFRPNPFDVVSRAIKIKPSDL